MIFPVTFIAFATIVAAMAVGVMAGRASISGSRGGVGRLGIDQKCDLCGGDPRSVKPRPVVLGRVAWRQKLRPRD